MRRPRRARRLNVPATLSITSMMDMMTIILVFLLQHFSVDELALVQSSSLQMPISSSETDPKLALTITISPDAIFLGDERIGTDLVDEMARNMFKERLLEATRKRLEEGKEAQSEVLVQVDRRVPFERVRTVARAAGEVGYGGFRFVVIRDE